MPNYLAFTTGVVGKLLSQKGLKMYANCQEYSSGDLKTCMKHKVLVDEKMRSLTPNRFDVLGSRIFDKNQHMANFTIYFPRAIQVSMRNFPHRLTQDPEKKAKSLVAEINNGRLAMMAIIGALLGLVVERLLGFVVGV